MKCRTGFVSNSSSTSFYLYKKDLNEEKILYLRKKLGLIGNILLTSYEIQIKWYLYEHDSYFKFYSDDVQDGKFPHELIDIDSNIINDDLCHENLNSEIIEILNKHIERFYLRVYKLHLNKNQRKILSNVTDEFLFIGENDNYFNISINKYEYFINVFNNNIEDIIEYLDYKYKINKENIVFIFDFLTSLNMEN